jgi:hypothetical protein
MWTSAQAKVAHHHTACNLCPSGLTVLQEEPDATPCGATDSDTQAAPMDGAGDNKSGGAIQP